MASKINWGIIGTGAIARAFASHLKLSETGQLAAVGSRNRQTAEHFARQFDLQKAHPSYQDLIDDPGVQAVYISTPHPMHAQWAIRCAEAGKHILCEKPIALNQYDAMAIIEAARENDVFMMEAFMYRCHPQTLKLIELLHQNIIGEVRLVCATFSFNAGFHPESRLLNQALGGGGILDVGCYCASMARLVAGAAQGMNASAEPIEVKGQALIGSVTRVDEVAVAAALFPGGILAQLATGVLCNQDNCVRIYGSEGHIHIPNPWVPTRDGGTSHIILCRDDEPLREIPVESPGPIYAIEADTVAACLDNRQAIFPAMTWDDTLGNMRMLDAWRASIGLVYDDEMPAARIHPLHGRPLKARSGNNMIYGKLPGLDKSVSRLVMGVDHQTFMPHASVMFDAYYEHGGNCFDTAWIYGGNGACEKILGHWSHNRGVRDSIIILEKGGHTPWCNPSDIRCHLEESLNRLQTDYVDIYMMHRDNPGIPVGEFIDILNRLQHEGIIRVFGASNWTRERFAEANDYARVNGLNGFAALSNNFSLARMIMPPWDGCLSSSGPDWRNWLTETQTPLFAWSSQARGFFSGIALPDDRSNSELVRCWYSDDNFKRLERAVMLAKQLSVLPINIALAYVLSHPFPAFPLIGPRTIPEFKACLAALDVQLSEQQMAWLDLRTD
ncbi:MAG: aldo/keto reductase [bacterium]